MGLTVLEDFSQLFAIPKFRHSTLNIQTSKTRSLGCVSHISYHSLSLAYSYLNESTGFCNADLTDCNATVINAITSETTPDNRNIHHAIFV